MLVTVCKMPNQNGAPRDMARPVMKMPAAVRTTCRVVKAAPRGVPVQVKS